MDGAEMSISARMNEAEPLLSVRGLSKFYGNRIGCADVSFDLFPGEVLGIVGESGSGKSTLLSCLAGHQAPDTGGIRFGGRDVLAMSEPERRRRRLKQRFGSNSSLCSAWRFKCFWSW